MRLVIDASVAMKWFLPEQLADHADRLLDGRFTLAAPDFLLVECANVAWRKMRLGELDARDGERLLGDLESGPVELLATVPLIGRASRLAREIDHPVCDCLYLAAAEACDAVAVTADKRFLQRTRDTAVAERLEWLEAVQD